MKLPFAYYGNAILRKKAEPIVTFDRHLIELIEHMTETVQSVNGLGLSAPQVGVSKALFITNGPEENGGELLTSNTALKVYINPKIESISEEVWLEEEGCLSIPKVYVHVERPIRITITAQNEHGDWRTELLEGWNAKIALHENDHLNGVLFIDRISRRNRKSIEKELEMIKKKFTLHNKALKCPM